MQFRGGATYFRKLMERFSIVVEYSAKLVVALSVVWAFLCCRGGAFGSLGVCGSVLQALQCYSATVLGTLTHMLSAVGIRQKVLCPKYNKKYILLYIYYT